MINKLDVQPGQVMFARNHIVWCGLAYDHLYVILSDGRTYRLDKLNNKREWTEVATIPINEK